MIKGVIFDFNGTLFFDTEKHILAWRDYSKEILGRPLTKTEFDGIMGQTNELIIKFLLGRTPTEEEVAELGGKKEELYREACFADPENLHLENGVAELFDKLCQKGIKLAIATSSPPDNVDFYFEQFGIDRWFDRTTVVYDDGTINSKPAPDIYLKAANSIGVDPSECIVFEDAVSGIRAARNAGVKKIIAVASSTPAEILGAEENVFRVISDYTEITDIDEIL